MMTDNIQITANKIAGLILKMYLKDKRAQKISPKVVKKKSKGGNNALF